MMAPPTGLRIHEIQRRRIAEPHRLSDRKRSPVDRLERRHARARHPEAPARAARLSARAGARSVDDLAGHRRHAARDRLLRCGGLALSVWRSTRSAKRLWTTWSAAKASGCCAAAPT